MNEKRGWVVVQNLQVGVVVYVGTEQENLTTYHKVSNKFRKEMITRKSNESQKKDDTRHDVTYRNIFKGTRVLPWRTSIKPFSCHALQLSLPMESLTSKQCVCSTRSEFLVNDFNVLVLRVVRTSSEVDLDFNPVCVTTRLTNHGQTDRKHS